MKSTARMVVPLFILAAISAAGPAGAGNIMLLGDDGGETQVEAALVNAGHSVTYAGIYHEWDGVTPDVDAFDAVVFLDAYDYGYGLSAAGETALVEYVEGGGNLIVTEWIAYDVDGGYYGAGFEALMPVTYVDYDYEATWTIADPGHPIADTLPASWFETGGFSFVEPKAGSTVVIESETGNPLVTYSAPNGIVIHINTDLTYSVDLISDNMLQLFVNAVGYVCEAVPTEPVRWSDVKALYRP